MNNLEFFRYKVRRWPLDQSLGWIGNMKVEECFRKHKIIFFDTRQKGGWDIVESANVFRWSWSNSWWRVLMSSAIDRLRPATSRIKAGPLGIWARERHSETRRDPREPAQTCWFHVEHPHHKSAIGSVCRQRKGNHFIRMLPQVSDGEWATSLCAIRKHALAYSVTRSTLILLENRSSRIWKYALSLVNARYWRPPRRWTEAISPPSDLPMT